MVHAFESVRSSYVPARDFCAIFQKDMKTLYSLALLLTADERKAEQCFLSAFHDCVDGSDVFSDWARSWSRRAIIKQAIRAAKPRSDDSDTASSTSLLRHEHVPTRLISMAPFDRFVFAMTVLERFTVRESAALLNCMPSDVEKARVRVLQRLGEQSAPVHAVSGSRPSVQAGTACANF